MRLYISLTLFLVTALSACKQKADKNKQKSINVQTFEMARAAQDYRTASYALYQIALEDTTEKWAWDSLAYYYSFYMRPDMYYASGKTGEYFIKEAVKRNPNSSFIQEIQAKMELEKGNIQTGLDMMEKLWKNTKDYTYLYNIAAMNFLQNRPESLYISDSLVNNILTQNPIPSGKVRIEDINSLTRQEVPIEAAFIYLKAVSAAEKNNLPEANRFLNRALQLDSNYYLAKKMLYSLNNPQR